MPTLYQRTDTKNYSVCFYPRPGGKLVRASLGVDDPDIAGKVLRKVELLCELEKMRDIRLPANAVGAFSLWQEAASLCSSAGQEDGLGRCRIVDALKTYMAHAAASNVRHALADKLSRLRQIFGSRLVASIDPRPAEHRKRAGKKAEVQTS